ncbi:hypothetical protein FRB94_012962 [Tulasnella sp. JGI-2019a]|nr:hypothetical protein FRB94_012962 [Tulasnella sp. JGI-2019a]
MAFIIDTDFIISAPHKSFHPAASSSKSITKPRPVTLLPAGAGYLAHARRTLNQHSFDDEDRLRDEAAARDLENMKGLDGTEDDLGVGDEPEHPDLLLSDPKRWKDLDQYAVLGLSHLRFKATDEQIKIAHRKKVLKHHPDKKANSGDSNDDAFFKCIQKAHEVLLDKERRRQFDSIDPYYINLEDSVPTTKDISGAKDPEKAFFKLFGQVFDREAHFCANHPEEQVPRLGAPNASKQEVESFYDFWYNFDSWRTFEWLDKEINEGSNNRDDKRYTEKKNKNERARRKKEDNQRLREFVDLALSIDPRIKRIKQEEKEERERKKSGKAKTAAPPKPRTAKEKEEAAQRAKEEADAKAKQEAEEKTARLVEKKQRDADKKREKRAAKAAAGGGDATT